MSTDAWDEIQELKIKRSVFREKLEKRKKERHELLGTPFDATYFKTEGSSYEDKTPFLAHIKQEIGIFDNLVYASVR